MIKKLIKKIFPIKAYRVGNVLFIKFGSLNTNYRDSLFIHNVSGLKCFVRDDYIINLCKNKRVLHFGFLDCPITQEKINTYELLHTKISSVASYLFGVDIDDNALLKYRELSGDSQNCILDILQDNSDLAIFNNKFDVILLPEVLEHLHNPMRALSNLKRILEMNPKSSLLITVPNAYSKEHFVAAMNSLETVHSDHYYYFSPVTLKKILSDAGLLNVEVFLYSHKLSSSYGLGITNHGVMALCHVI